MRALAGALLAASVACSDINNHLLEGQQYSPAGACLAAPTVIDDLPGGDPGDNCAPECLRVPAEGGAVVFITTTCPPYAGYPAPELQDAGHDAADPCVGAFAAFYGDASVCTSLDGEAPEASAGASDAARESATTDASAEAAADGGAEAAVESGADAGMDAATGG
jgi:hypothetical protein